MIGEEIHTVYRFKVFALSQRTSKGVRSCWHDWEEGEVRQPQGTGRKEWERRWREGRWRSDQMHFITLLGSPCSQLLRKTVLRGPNFPCEVSAEAELVGSLSKIISGISELCMQAMKWHCFRFQNKGESFWSRRAQEWEVRNGWVPPP